MTIDQSTGARGFVLHKEARNYFDYADQRMFSRTRSSDVSRGTLLLFDAYYASLMLGLVCGETGKIDMLDTGEFILNYPNEYEPYREYIAGLLVDAEVTAIHSDDYSERQLERLIAKLLQVASPTRLSPNGMHILNLYAAGGFDLLRSRMGTRPSDPSNFLIRYQTLLTNAIGR